MSRSLELSVEGAQLANDSTDAVVETRAALFGHIDDEDLHAFTRVLDQLDATVNDSE